MVIVPVRAGPVFAATVKLTDPVPMPAAPAVIVIHDGALLTAVHAHVAPVVTAIAVPAPPAAAIDSLSKRSCRCNSVVAVAVVPRPG
jgi:hypothetical protein